MELKNFERFVPSVLKYLIKRVYWGIARIIYRIVYMEKSKFAELGKRFRLTRRSPYIVKLGYKTIVEMNNTWDAQLGDIIVGEKCWFGVNNVIMGPLEIGDNFSSGPYVKIVGSRHFVLSANENERKKTVIGNNVTVATGSIILFGVKIGDGAIISAGSVVGKDVPPGAFFGGNPARNLTSIAQKGWSIKKSSQENE